MSGAFADTSYFIALLSPRDELHLEATHLSRVYDARILTTEYVLLEVANWLSDSGDRRLFSALLGDLRASPRVQILESSPELFEMGVRMYHERPDKDWSLTDCISFVVMERHGLSEALTADHHFEQAGFKNLL
ncbi:MAG: hypothetical protein GHCLOJNM_04555 [bacterium]|nr:hypothetical protein [bacterium]